jgi:hypothetical protein
MAADLCDDPLRLEKAKNRMKTENSLADGFTNDGTRMDSGTVVLRSLPGSVQHRR